MKSSNISYLRSHLSEVLSCVKEGETVLVLDRKKPVACLTPVPVEGGTINPRVTELRNQGLLKHTPPDAPPKTLRPLKLADPVDVVGYLLEDREES